MRAGVAAADATISHCCISYSKIVFDYTQRLSGYFLMLRHSISSLVIRDDFLLLIRLEVDYSSAQE